jgi:D-alanine--poly(phosphoribitol) ligase subunit 1
MISFINLGDAFDYFALRYKDNIALEYSDAERYSYGDLSAFVNHAKLFLLGQNLTKSDHIGIFNDKSPHGYALILGCISLGISYSNFDSEMPEERLEKILNVINPKIIISFVDSVFDKYKKIDIKKYQPGTSLSIKDDIFSVCKVESTDCAYVMFTSGSTGTPKGVAISHANLIWFISWAKNRFQISPSDKFAGLNPIYFDNSIFDLYCSIFNGATLCPIKKFEIENPKKLIKKLDDLKVTIWFSVPSLLIYFLTLKVLSPDNLLFIRKIVFGGEGFPKNKLKTLFDIYANRIDLENVYGPTECTCICSAKKVDISDFDDMTGYVALGVLADNFSYQILPIDENENFGELFLMGPQVGLGYYNDINRTLNSFIPDPINTNFYRIGYKTGDIVERDTQKGLLYFRGRSDNQIKYLGHRIELEEIELLLNLHSLINECIADFKNSDHDLKFIRVFYSANNPIDEMELQTFLRGKLPSYMIPKAFIYMPKLPKNSNGKLDRKSLITY